MSDSNSRKPSPARSPKSRTKPTPVRQLSGEPSPSPAEIDVAEVELEVGDERWTVRVRGRSGGVSDAKPPLLLLGFWKGDDAEGPSLEALVVGRSLADMPAESLRTAFAGASEPRDPERRPPFFAGASQRRRR